MQRFLSHFQSLGWKLTLSYTLVTVAALLVVEIIGLSAALIFLLSPQLLPRLAAQVIVATAPEASPYLEQQPPDLVGLQSWLARASIEGLASSNNQGRSMSFTPGSLTEGSTQLMVLDTHLDLLAAAPAKADLAIGKPYQGKAAFQPVLEAALAGESDHTQLFLLTPDKTLFVAAPIKNQGGKVLGLLVFSGELIPQTQPFGQLLSLLGVSLIVFTLAAGAIGTIFGFFTARGLSRRLRTVSSTADSWSRGDFSAFVKDRSGDEIGQLANRLNRMAEQLQNLLQTRQELAALEERNRLARDLHDSVKQEVFATAMQVGAAQALIDSDPQAAKEHLDEAESLARQAQAELTALIRELRPASLESQGLSQALADYAVGWSRQTGIRSEVHLQGERSLPLSLEQALFRVAQEALSNITRHSRASEVQIQLIWGKDDLQMVISDNGQGFDPGSVSGKGVGMQSMRERVEALGGQFDVESSPGQGTRVTVTINTALPQS